MVGSTLRRLAEASLHEGNAGEALRLAQRALDVNRSCSDRKEEAATLRVLGDIARARRRRRAAEKAYGASVRILESMGARGELKLSKEAIAALDSEGTESEPEEGLAVGDSDIVFTIPSEGWKFISRDRGMINLVERLKTLAPNRGTVLLLGETGTGKEILARFLHEASGRKGAFIAANASAFPESLVESELFGHVRGAFTGAAMDRKGLFEAAQGGTFFLDEVGDLPLAMQAKLLRTLEERAVKRVGSIESRRIDVRFVAATNRNLREEMKTGGFRPDLYYRLSVHEFEIPALRRRPDDVLVLARHFLARHAPEWGKSIAGISSRARKGLVRYPWPGNVRELDNEMQRAASRASDGTPLQLENLSPAVQAAAGKKSPVGLFEDVALLERARIESALEASGGNQARAGKILGMSRQALRYKVLKYGIKVRKKP